MINEKFLFDSKLNTALEDLITEANEKLILISPYIDLAPRIKSALNSQLEKKDPNFELKVLFGKDGMSRLKKQYRSQKLQESMRYLMTFPNVEIKCEPLLHAKYYRNDYHVLFSSMNLYDYSAKVNIEFGILEEYASKGALRRAGDFLESKINDTAGALGEKVLGKTKEMDPIEKFEKIFNEAETVYKSKAILEDKKDLTSKAIGYVGYQRQSISGTKIKVDKLSEIFSSIDSNPPKEKVKTYDKTNVNSKRLVSATVLGKSKDLNYKAVIEQLASNGMVSKDGKQLLEKGKGAGIETKSSENGEWLVYPEDLLDKI